MMGNRNRVNPAVWPPIPNRKQFVFFDEFTYGVSGSTRCWYTAGGGTIQTASWTSLSPMPNDVGGKIVFDGWNGGGTFTVNHNNLGCVSAAAHASFFSRDQMRPDADNGGNCVCGLQACTTPESNDIKWRHSASDSNYFQAVCTSGGTETAQDSAVAVDTAYHEFGFVCETGRVMFFLDGIYATTITTNIPTGILQPFYATVGVVLGSTHIVDWVDVRGDRS